MGFVDTFEPTNFQFFFIPRDHYRTLLKGLWPRPSRPNACKIRFFPPQFHSLIWNCPCLRNVLDMIMRKFLSGMKPLWTSIHSYLFLFTRVFKLPILIKTFFVKTNQIGSEFVIIQNLYFRNWLLSKQNQLQTDKRHRSIYLMFTPFSKPNHFWVSLGILVVPMS